ncbi:hypothetical protein Q1J52_21020 [Pseudomonas lijiangensis]|uniref:hypothetical protein n=1 Tax=Pseudomonas lijiangensis TaxID=2995658 RepID=UPI0034D97C19
MKKTFEDATPAKLAILISFWTMLIALASPISSQNTKITLLAIALTTYIVSFMSILSILKSYTKNSKSLEGFLVIYIDVTFLFAAIYFFMAALTPAEEVIYGVKKICMTITCYNGPLTQISTLIESFLDCIYFSILTMTTSGDTNIGVKTFWGRFTVSAQLITTVYISIVGLAKYFSQKSSEELTELKTSILNSIQTENPPQRPNQNKSSLIQKIMQIFK